MEDTFSELEEVLKNPYQDFILKEVGSVLSITTGIAYITGLPKVAF